MLYVIESLSACAQLTRHTRGMRALALTFAVTVAPGSYLANLS